MEFGHNIKLNICLFEDLPVRMEKREAKKKRMYVPSERQRSRFMMAHIDMWNFKNKCHLQHAFIIVTELFWTRTEV